EVMQEIEQRLGTRQEFPYVEGVPRGKKAIVAYLKPPVGPVPGELTDDDATLAEAIVLASGRPSLLIAGGTFQPPELDVWKQRLRDCQSTVEALIPPAGRVELLNHPDSEWVGTAWVIDEGLLVTNRHVAEVFCRRHN